MLPGGDIGSLQKKNLFLLKGCSRVDRTKSHRNDTFMYLHLEYSYSSCYNYCPNGNVLGVDEYIYVSLISLMYNDFIRL